MVINHSNQVLHVYHAQLEAQDVQHARLMLVLVLHADQDLEIPMLQEQLHVLHALEIVLLVIVLHQYQLLILKNVYLLRMDFILTELE